MNNIIDLRSDTVTKPSEAMRKAMYDAEVGDDVYKEDKTVFELEEYVAKLLHKEAALFVPSGVMGNQICLNIHTQPGDEVICEADAHIFQYESGSPAVLSGIQLNPVKAERGILKPEIIEPLIRPTSAYYMPRTKVIEAENTHNRAGGTIYKIDEIKALSTLAQKYSLMFHLDGARLWNAAIASGNKLSDFTNYFDSVSICLSKGLGAPIGSVIAGRKEFITEAFRVRKAWGGGMRQVGVIASAGLFAVKNNFERLAEDHQKAKQLAKHIEETEKFELVNKDVETNIIIFKPLEKTIEEALDLCKQEGLLLSVGQVGTLRAVTHLDVSHDEIVKACKIIDKIFN
ncbi:MAG: low specificity L-threonine aldolase [Ignavibacteriae bacterium]|nr:MAG: low specificity L-threonine aldolase [Ignavibacteriota bacterium]